MKKLLIAVVVVAVVAAFAFSVSARENVKIKAKTPEYKEVVKVEDVPEGVKVLDVTKHKHGDLWKDTVKFKSYRDGDDYVYLVKEDRVYRVKFRKQAKDSLMRLRRGQKVDIVSTHPLSGPELADYITLYKIERAR